MITPRFPDTILDEHLTTQLLRAMKVGVLDMAYFPGLYFPPIGEPRDLSGLSEEDFERVQTIYQKIRYSNDGQITLTREQKIKLLKAIRIGRINPDHDFPEFAKAYRVVKSDWSAITPEESEFILEIARMD